MSNTNININNYGRYSVEECIENMLKRINKLEEENKELKNNFVGETISDEVIQLLNKKLKNDIILLCNKIDQICGENIELTQDQKMFNKRVRDDIVLLTNQFDKIQMTVQNIESEMMFIKKISQVAFDKVMKLDLVSKDNATDNVADKN
jgi:hypothetical protein